MKFEAADAPDEFVTCLTFDGEEIKPSLINVTPRIPNQLRLRS